MVSNTASHPVAKNDLVFGEDFLSIYINQDKRHPSRNAKYRSKFLFDSDDRTYDIANKDIVPVPPSSVIADKRYTDNKYQQQSNNVYETVSADTSKTKKNEVDPNRNIVKLVTTGSKIVFFEDDDDDDDALTTNGNADKNLDHDMSASEMAEDMTMPDEIKIVSVSVSSSKTRTKSIEREKPAITASKSMKDELMVDEDEPANDSLNQESMRIHTIISPPSDLKPASVDDNRSAELNPVQTVIIHNNGAYQREGSARPRSVSYSSVSQTIHRQPFESAAPLNLTRKTNQPHLPQPKLPKIYSEPAKIYSEPAHNYSQASKVYGEPSKFYSEPSKIYSEPSKVYSEPEKVYSVPSKVYSEPSKVYSEPSKFYSEPAKVYSQPSKIYGEPSKFYSLPAGTIEQPQPVTIAPTSTTTTTTKSPPTLHKKIIFNLDKLPYDLLNAPTGDNTDGYSHVNSHTGEKRFHPSSGTMHRHPYPAMHADMMDAHQPNADLVNSSMIDMIENRFQSTISLSKIPEPSVPDSRTTAMLDESTSSSSSLDNGNDDVDPKVGYVVEGRNFRKYRVEEKTSDGFIVGEYGVVSTNDGSLRGVRYTADSNINPNLIHKALMKFLSL